jgi:hypothetical protein
LSVVVLLLPVIAIPPGLPVGRRDRGVDPAEGQRSFDLRGQQPVLDREHGGAGARPAAGLVEDVRQVVTDRPVRDIVQGFDRHRRKAEPDTESPADLAARPARPGSLDGCDGDERPRQLRLPARGGARRGTPPPGRRRRVPVRRRKRWRERRCGDPSRTARPWPGRSSATTRRGPPRPVPGACGQGRAGVRPGHPFRALTSRPAQPSRLGGARAAARRPGAPPRPSPSRRLRSRVRPASRAPR